MGGVAGRLITHNAKLYDSGVDAGVRLFARRTLEAALSAASGMHSMSIATNRYAVGLMSQAADIGLAQDLSCDAGAPVPGSILGLALAGDDAAILAIPTEAVKAKTAKSTRKAKAVDPDSAEKKRKAAEAAARSVAVVSDVQASPEVRDGLRRAIADATEGMPDRIDPSQKQVWFEAQGREVLVTPVVSLKVVGELSLALLTDDKLGARPRRIDLPVGGANPQNVGYVAGRTNRSSRRGAIPLLYVACPRGLATNLSRLRARVMASGGLRALMDVDVETWNGLRARADGGYDLAIHLAADAEDAAELVSAFMSHAKDLRASGTWPEEAMADVAGREGADVGALRLVGAVEGVPDVEALSGRLATLMCHVAARRAAAVQPKGERPPSGPPGARIHDALRTAFAEGIRACLG